MNNKLLVVSMSCFLSSNFLPTNFHECKIRRQRSALQEFVCLHEIFCKITTFAILIRDNRLF